jgi:MFS transporter, PAT family, beta-lactamase induction signal transducer AmpG
MGMDSISEKRRLLADIVSDRTLVVMLALGFSSGLPFLLIFSTQSAWLKEAQVSLTAIGFFSYVALAYSLKFLWAPILDTVDLPVLSHWLGRRRAWMLVAQMGVTLGLAGLAFGNPAQALATQITISFLIGFCAATQDVAIDGWRIEAAPSERQGMMSATYQLGYRLALLCAGAGALYIAQFFSWEYAYLAMAGAMTIGIVATISASRSKKEQDRASQATDHDRLSLEQTFFQPLADLLRRKGGALFLILILVACYRLPDFVSGVMANPLYIQLGFSKVEIANISKIYGVWIGIAGAFAGGILVSRLGLMPTLLCGGIAASASHLTLSYLAASGAKLDLLTLAISVENFASGFAGTALIAYMSSLTSPAFAATQYALLSSLYALPGKLIGGLSGWLVEQFGFPHFFMLTSAIGIPVVILCLLIWRYSARPATDGERVFLDKAIPHAEATASPKS